MIRFFFEYNRKIIQLPINPEGIEIVSKVKTDKTTILKLGEIATSGFRNLQEFKISSFLPSSDKYPFILTKGKFKKPKFYIDFFNQIIEDKKPMKLIITDVDINIEVLITNFTYSQEAQDDDTHFNLTLTEFKSYGVKTYNLQALNNTQPVAETQRTASSDEITVGKKVIVNGQLFRDSYGGGPGKTLTNYTGVVSIIKKGRTKPYHITNLNGGWLGWVSSSSVKGV